MDGYLISVLANIGMFSFVALSAYLLLIVGEISFGQQAFFGIGAYAAGVTTAVWRLDFPLALLIAAITAAAAAALLGTLTLRLRGLYFAMATLAFAELVRHGFELWSYRRQIGSEWVGPDGPDGFRDIRYLFEHNFGLIDSLMLIYGLLAAVLFCFWLIERGRLGSMLRVVGADVVLAETQGIDVIRIKIVSAAASGAIAGIGGCLYAHLTTYIEPNLFNIMLGVHALAYGLIGGLGTAFGPILGVTLDIGFLESIRVLQGYRMIVFGGLVALLLIVMPRGIFDEPRVRWILARLHGRLRAKSKSHVAA